MRLVVAKTATGVVIGGGGEVGSLNEDNHWDLSKNEMGSV